MRRLEGDQGSLVLHVAESTDDLDDTTESLLATLGIAIPTLAVLFAGLTWWLVGRTLRPVEAMRAEADSISDTRKLHQLAQPRRDDEIGRLAGKLNQMLARLHRSGQSNDSVTRRHGLPLRSTRSTVSPRLLVDDDGPGLAVDDRETIFERFTRLDEARSVDVGGAGLGLAIVRAAPSSEGAPMNRVTKIIIGAAAATGAVVGGFGIASATSADDSSTDDDVPITGQALERATAAALAETGGGEVTEVEDEGDVAYEIEIVMDDGTELEIELDAGFNFLGVEDESDDDEDDEDDDD